MSDNGLDWNAIGARIGRALASLTPSAVQNRIRAGYAAKYGTCRRCAAPLGGHSPQRICQGCHADEVLANGNDNPVGEA